MVEQKVEANLPEPPRTNVNIPPNPLNAPLSVKDLDESAIQRFDSATYTTDGDCQIISKDGMQSLRCLTINGRVLGDVELLQIAMSSDPRISDDVKRRLLYGLLFDNGLTLVRENNVTIAPTHLPSPPSITLSGRISFVRNVPRRIETLPLNAIRLCNLKRNSGSEAHHLIGFILQELQKLPQEESFSDLFRLKSYSSVMNKLFYRGGNLTDLYGATVPSNSKVLAVEKKLLAHGAIDANDQEDRDFNGNGCAVYRWVRILQIDLQNLPDQPLHFPVYYEVVRKNFLDERAPHKNYELTRLKFQLAEGLRTSLENDGFRFDPVPQRINDPT